MTASELFCDAGFRDAATDYLWLRTRSYPETASLKLVGDRYRLGRTARNALFRSIFPAAQARKRRERLAPSISGRPLVVDAYNVSLTILNYRLGHPVFRSADGLVRDSGGAKRRVNRLSAYLAVLGDLGEFLAVRAVEHCDFYFDQPFSGSSAHAQAMEAAAKRADLSATCRLVETADRTITHAANDEPGCLLATSDSQIIDKTAAPIADIAGLFLQWKHVATIPDVRSLFTEAEDSQYF